MGLAVGDTADRCNLLHWSSCASSSTQAIAICSEMKGRGIQVWTIGFGMSTDPIDPARQALVACVVRGRCFFPYDGDGLRAVLAAIGQSLSETIIKPRIVRSPTVPE